MDTRNDSDTFSMYFQHFFAQRHVYNSSNSVQFSDVSSISSALMNDCDILLNDASTERETHPILTEILNIWLKYKRPICAFDDMIKILRNIPTTDTAFKSAINTTFNKCVQDVLHENNVLMYIECETCHGFQEHAMIEMGSPLTCQQCTSKLKAENYFIYIGCSDQITSSLKKNFDQIIEYYYKICQKIARGESGICDVWDGDILRNLVTLNSGKIVLSYACNTDRVSIWGSNHTSIWPIQLQQNNLPPQSRFQTENILLIGFFVGRHAPNMNNFFYPFLCEFLELENDPILHSYDGREYECKPYITHCVVDLPAKNKLQGIKLYCGHNACTYCLHPGIPIRSRAVPERKYIRYVAQQTPSPYRDSIETVEIMRNIDTRKNRRTNQGVDSISCMVAFPHFDIIYSFPIDYMHESLLGVMRTLTNLWFSTKYATEKFHVRLSWQKIIIKRLKQYKPFSLCGAARTIDELKQYKAKDFRKQQRKNWKGL